MTVSSFAFNFNVLTFVLVNLLIIAKADDLKVKLVQLLIRHGDRSPMKTFPTDPWKNAWPEGFGQLTKLGMQQQYETGKYLRQLYGVLINYSYNYKTLHVQSGDTDRALMGAYVNLAGFLPPQGSQIWSKDLAWQPIPVHAVPGRHDYLLAISQECPNYDKLFQEQMNTPDALAINSKYGDLYKYLTDKTGMNVTTYEDATYVYDTLLAQKNHKLTLPDWVNETIFSDLRENQILNLVMPVKTQAMRRLYSGTLVGEMVKNMQTSISDTTDQHKIYMFIAYDNTIVSFLSALEVFDTQLPPYCSVVAVELLEENGNYFVNISYRNDTSHFPYELTLKGCSNPCPFNQFKNLTASVVPTDIISECFD